MAVRGAAERISSAMSILPGVVAGPHRFGGTEYRLGRREIGHAHGDQLVDLPFTRAVRDLLVSTGQAERHHIHPESGWVSIYLRRESDVNRAIELLHRSFEIARASLGSKKSPTSHLINASGG
jgi:Family of unknown function (DUF5519)